MRDTAGQLADDFHLLNLAQRCLGDLAPVCFGLCHSHRAVSSDTASQRDDRQQYQAQRRRQAEHQMAGHHLCPTLDDGGPFEPHNYIDRIGAKFAICEEPFYAVDIRGGSVASCVWLLCDLLAEVAGRRQHPANHVLTRRACQHGAIRTRHRHQEIAGIDNRTVVFDEIG